MYNKDPEIIVYGWQRQFSHLLLVFSRYIRTAKVSISLMLSVWETECNELTDENWANYEEQETFRIVQWLRVLGTSNQRSIPSSPSFCPLSLENYFSVKMLTKILFWQVKFSIFHTIPEKLDFVQQRSKNFCVWLTKRIFPIATGISWYIRLATVSVFLRLNLWKTEYDEFTNENRANYERLKMFGYCSCWESWHIMSKINSLLIHLLVL